MASGDLLRAAVRKRTALGMEAKRYMDKGALVPDELVLKLIEERLQQPDAAVRLHPGRLSAHGGSRPRR